MTMREIKLRRRPLRDRVSLLTTQLEQQRMRIDALADRVAKLEQARPVGAKTPNHLPSDPIGAWYVGYCAGVMHTVENLEAWMPRHSPAWSDMVQRKLDEIKKEHAPEQPYVWSSKP